MAFSFVGILAVLLETFRPLLPYLIAWIIVDVGLLIHTARLGQFAHRKARSVAFVIGIIAMAAAFALGPTWTQATFGNFISPIDWILLGAMSFGVGVAAFLLTLPISSLIQSKTT